MSYPSMLFVPGEPVRFSGVYEILHPTHRAPHEAFLWEGEIFPHCQQCHASVIFRLVCAAEEPLCEHISADTDFSGAVTKG